ncbi:MAG: CRISPR-associated protein Cas4 [Candidatus Bipolaricaulia bacterium]
MTTEPSNSLIYTGTQVNYYLVCKRKLWLFSHDLEMEHTSDAVLIGRLIHESSYPREHKELMIDEKIVIDFSSRQGVINEVKKSSKVEEAHRYQLLYYLYYLKRKGVENVTGAIRYPKLRRKVEVELTEEAEREIERILERVGEVITAQDPPPRLDKHSFCKKCSYFELCYS